MKIHFARIVKMSVETKLRWSSRKFWSAMIWMLIMVCLLREGTLPVAAFESLTWLLLGGYFMGNVAQKYIDRNGK